MDLQLPTGTLPLQFSTACSSAHRRITLQISTSALSHFHPCHTLLAGCLRSETASRAIVASLLRCCVAIEATHLWKKLMLSALEAVSLTCWRQHRIRLHGVPWVTKFVGQSSAPCSLTEVPAKKIWRSCRGDQAPSKACDSQSTFWSPQAAGLTQPLQHQACKATEATAAKCIPPATQHTVQRIQHGASTCRASLLCFEALHLTHDPRALCIVHVSVCKAV